MIIDCHNRSTDQLNVVRCYTTETASDDPAVVSTTANSRPPDFSRAHTERYRCDTSAGEPQRFCSTTLQRSKQGCKTLETLYGSERPVHAASPAANPYVNQPHKDVSMHTQTPPPATPWHSHHTHKNSRALQHSHTPGRSVLGQCMQENISPAGGMLRPPTNKQAWVQASTSTRELTWLAELACTQQLTWSTPQGTKQTSKALTARSPDATRVQRSLHAKAPATPAAAHRRWPHHTPWICLLRKRPHTTAVRTSTATEVQSL